MRPGVVRAGPPALDGDQSRLPAGAAPCYECRAWRQLQNLDHRPAWPTKPAGLFSTWCHWSIPASFDRGWTGGGRTRALRHRLSESCPLRPTLVRRRCGEFVKQGGQEVV